MLHFTSLTALLSIKRLISSCFSARYDGVLILVIISSSISIPHDDDCDVDGCAVCSVHCVGTGSCHDAALPLSAVFFCLHGRPFFLKPFCYKNRSCFYDELPTLLGHCHSHHRRECACVVWLHVQQRDDTLYKYMGGG